ncbi:hypothetical protein RYX36_009599, partial [Vicia faba]
NKLRGTIPIEVFKLSSLSILLNLSHNFLRGILPREVGMLKNINVLDISENHLSGDIPTTIGECTSLEYILLQSNFFNGTIPSTLASLKGLRYLDPSRNRLTGSILDVMQNISVLKHLNVSFNMLEGEVPIDGVFGNASQVAIIGNNKLCGGISQLHLPPCPINGKIQTKHHKIKLIATIVSYQDLHRGTNGFSAGNLIGSGSSSSVYKGNLVSEDNVVAVKVKNLKV